MHNDNTRQQLEREAQRLGRALFGSEPSAYVVSKYVSYHQETKLTGDGLDRYLIAAAMRGRFFARAADAYACRFHRHGAIRKKLMLLLALAEVAPPHCDQLDSIDASGLAAWFALAGTAAAHVCALGAGMVVFGPVHLLRGAK